MSQAQHTWQPIETAPKNLAPLLLRVPGRIFATYGWRNWATDTWREPISEEFLQPTHWMPLPDPPESQKEGAR